MIPFQKLSDFETYPRKTTSWLDSFFDEWLVSEGTHAP